MTDASPQTPPQNHATAEPFTDADLRSALVEAFAGKRGTILLAWLHATAGTRRSLFTPAAGGGPCDTHLAAKRDGAASLVWIIEEKLAVARAHHAGKPPAPPAAIGGNPSAPARKRTSRRQSG